MENTEVFYVSEPMVIGKHEWRVRVTGYWLIDNPPENSRCTDYQFRRLGTEQWRYYREWPSYDMNKQRSGLPIGLTKIYERNRDTITLALHVPLTATS